MTTTENVRRSFMQSGPLRRVIARLIARPAQSTVGLVVSMLVVGAVFYHFVEGWNMLDSVYFCVITLATIGYGDYAPKTDLGKLFTIFYAFAGIGVLAFYFQLRAQQRLSRRPLVAETEKLAAHAEKDAAALEHRLEHEGDVLPHDPLP